MKNLAFILTFFGSGLISIASAQNGKLITSVSSSTDDAKYETVSWISSDGSVWKTKGYSDCPFSTPVKLAEANSASVNGTIRSCFFQRMQILVWISKTGNVSFWNSVSNKIATIGTNASLMSDVGILSANKNYLDVFWISATGQVMHNWTADGQLWNTQTERSNANSLADPSGSLAAVDFNGSRFNLFWVSKTGIICQNRFQRSRSTPQFDGVSFLPENQAHPKSGLSSAVLSAMLTQIYFLDKQGNITALYWQGNPGMLSMGMNDLWSTQSYLGRWFTTGTIGSKAKEATQLTTFVESGVLYLSFIGEDNKTYLYNTAKNQKHPMSRNPIGVGNGFSVNTSGSFIHYYYIGNNGKIINGDYSIADYLPTPMMTLSGKIQMPIQNCSPAAQNNYALLKNTLKFKVRNGLQELTNFQVTFGNVASSYDGFIYIDYQIQNLSAVATLDIRIYFTTSDIFTENCGFHGVYPQKGCCNQLDFVAEISPC